MMSLYYACWLDNMDGRATVVKFPSPPGFLDDEVFGLVPVEVKDQQVRRMQVVMEAPLQYIKNIQI